ncbi:MAG: pyruvate kinase alpha/beta domain-containing protein [Syntrophomonadaceae bacterium]|nr:pyruvate kinase alpha/beta domain-containing protein [Syntrophomonadaceae bacterium]
MYWESPGEENTDKTLEMAVKRARELDIKNLVVASCSGNTARKLLNSGLQIICVTHHVGFGGPGQDEMPEHIRQELIQAGAKVLTTTHLFAGVDRALRNQFGGVYPAEIIAQTLRTFGQGVKVAIEISCMAKDAGFIPHGAEVIAIGGSAEGADAAIVVVPAHSNHFFATEVREIICMPRLKKK